MQSVLSSLVSKSLFPMEVDKNLEEPEVDENDYVIVGGKRRKKNQDDFSFQYDDQNTARHVEDYYHIFLSTDGEYLTKANPIKLKEFLDSSLHSFNKVIFQRDGKIKVTLSSEVEAPKNLSFQGRKVIIGCSTTFFTGLKGIVHGVDIDIDDQELLNAFRTDGAVKIHRFKKDKLPLPTVVITFLMSYQFYLKRLD